MKNIETSYSSFHEQANFLIKSALVEEMKGNKDEARILNDRALELELKACGELKTDLNNQPLRTIVFATAASLALDLGLKNISQSLVDEGLKVAPPEELKYRLNSIKNSAKFEMTKKEQINQEILEREKIVLPEPKKYEPSIFSMPFSSSYAVMESLMYPSKPSIDVLTYIKRLSPSGYLSWVRTFSISEDGEIYY